MGTIAAMRSQSTHLTNFKFGTLRVTVKHENDDLSRYLEREMRPHLENGPIKRAHNAQLSLIPCARLPLLPSKAEFVRQEAGAEVYERGPSRCILANHYLVILDTKGRTAQAYYTDDADVYSRVRSVLKWLVITAAEEADQFYLHAGACSWSGKSVIYCGDSGAGKTSNLIRSAKLGAILVADDMVLADKNGILPIHLGAHIRGDAPIRFAIPEGERRLSEIGMVADRAQQGPHTVVLIHAWREQTSLLRRIAPKRAVLKLWKMYERESAYNAKAQSRSKWLAKGREFLHEASYFELFTGEDEALINSQLRSLFEAL
ncbi:MAG: hypothetical protein R3B54_06320 [Bdellovibrionota bacterium]